VRGVLTCVMATLCVLAAACERYDVPSRSDALPSCCEGAGVCVPAALAPAGMSQRLGADSCDEGALCAPRAFLEDPGATPARCQAAGELEGRCLPSCLPAVAERGEQLTRRDCDRDQRCVPCFDPSTGEDTGACRTGDDQPSDPPRTFERCCGSMGAELGTCLPLELLNAEQADALPVDSCSGPETRCAPSELTRAPYQLSWCKVPLLGSLVSEGLCLPECFVPFPARLLTPRGTCGASSRCVPCASLDSSQPGCE
jgi:hypothetical protein